MDVKDHFDHHHYFHPSHRQEWKERRSELRKKNENENREKKIEKE